MRTIICVLLTTLMLMAFTCVKEESENCHHNVIVKNVSGDTIIVAESAHYGNDNLWSLQGQKVGPGKSLVKKIIRECFESYLPHTETGKLELYIVDPILYNDPVAFYSFDSIEIKNRVLKHYSLTVDDLRALNFTVTYPDEQ